MESNKFPTEIIDLPSEGYFYPPGNPLSSGQLEIKYMTAKEEDILTSKNLIQKGTALDKLLESLIVSPIKYSDLLVGDKNAILIASRILAYGKDYDVDIVCDDCNFKFNTSIDLTTLKNKEVDTSMCEKGTRTFKISLPLSKSQVEIKLLNHEDELAIDSELKGLKKIVAIEGIERELTTRLKHIIVSISGDTSREKINNFVMEELLSRDLMEIKKSIKKILPDLDMEISKDCPKCSNTVKFSLPLNVDFFWPSGRE